VHLITSMNEREHSMKTLKGALKRMENPYARLSVFNDEDNKREAVFIAANPCATEYLESEGPMEQPSADRVSLPVITQREFSRRATEILKLYSPSFQRSGRLSPEKRAFIADGKTLPAGKRCMALRELEKFDIRSEGNFEPLLNRERDDTLHEKLRAITDGLK
jgi:hypothetical protein